MPPWFTGTQPGGGVRTIEPIAAAVAPTTIAAATGLSQPLLLLQQPLLPCTFTLTFLEALTLLTLVFRTLLVRTSAFLLLTCVACLLPPPACWARAPPPPPP